MYLETTVSSVLLNLMYVQSSEVSQEHLWSLALNYQLVVWDGHAFLDHLSWDNFNESGDLPHHVELFKSRFGHYPEAVYVDQIYRTRSNRAYCRNLGIQITAPPLGRPVPDDVAAIRK
ncbi:transposase (plasmid) [Pseudanabaena biceps]|nr:transposase [Pseudanabaena biceps]